MSNRRSRQNSNDRIVIRGVRRKQPDISKIAKAVIGLALEQAAREAAAQHQSSAATSQPSPTDDAHSTTQKGSADV